jgi:ATP-dependent RNA helicase DDX3X
LKVLYRGKDVVDTNEMKTFEDFPDLDRTIAENLKRMKFNQMTPIQKAVMPYIIKGNDVMGCSHTGSGKTVAFLLPIITKMIREGPPSDELDNGIARPVTLILIPTRELADQIYKEARKLVHKTGITVVKVYGGVGQYNQIRDLSYGCDILVATPGRLIDFIKTRRVSLNFVKYLIIDEADRLLDMGFEPQLNNIVFDYDLRSKDKRLNLMFSATLEDDVKTIARKFMNEYYFIHTNTELKASQNVTQMILFAKEEEKIIQLHQFLQKIKGSIISN